MTSHDFESFLRSIYAEGRPWGTPEMLDEFYDRVAPDLVFTRPPFPPVVGLEANRKDDEAMALAFSDQKMHIEEIIACGDSIALRYTWEGLHTGVSPTLGIPPTGKHVKALGCVVYHLQEGKMAEIVDYLDLLSLLQQVGVIPAMA